MLTLIVTGVVFMRVKTNSTSCHQIAVKSIIMIMTIVKSIVEDEFNVQRHDPT